MVPLKEQFFAIGNNNIRNFFILSHRLDSLVRSRYTEVNYIRRCLYDCLYEQG